jgi:hypothetical protein
MSRFYDCDDYDEWFPNQAALWRANADRAMDSKKGHAALADLREALRHLPEKRLIGGAFCTVDHERRNLDDGVVDDVGGEGVCAVGAYVWWQKVKKGADPAEAFAELPTLYGEDYGQDSEATASAGKAAGLAFPLAWDLAYMNDEQWSRCTPEERYERFMAWLDSKLAAVPS